MRESMHEEPTHEEPMLLLNGILGMNTRLPDFDTQLKVIVVMRLLA